MMKILVFIIFILFIIPTAGVILKLRAEKDKKDATKNTSLAWLSTGLLLLVVTITLSYFASWVLGFYDKGIWAPFRAATDPKLGRIVVISLIGIATLVGIAIKEGKLTWSIPNKWIVFAVTLIMLYAITWSIFPNFNLRSVIVNAVENIGKEDVVVQQEVVKDYINCPRGSKPSFQLKAGKYSPYLRGEYGTSARFQDKYGTYKLCFRGDKCYDLQDAPNSSLTDFRFFAITKSDVRVIFE